MSTCPPRGGLLTHQLRVSRSEMTFSPPKPPHLLYLPSQKCRCHRLRCHSEGLWSPVFSCFSFPVSPSHPVVVALHGPRMWLVPTPHPLSHLLLPESFQWHLSGDPRLGLRRRAFLPSRKHRTHPSSLRLGGRPHWPSPGCTWLPCPSWTRSGVLGPQRAAPVPPPALLAEHTGGLCSARSLMEHG